MVNFILLIFKKLLICIWLVLFYSILWNVFYAKIVF